MSEYIVHPDGDDANLGTELEPWRTIQHAADILLPGDAVYIKGGVYREVVIPARSGEDGAFITFAAYPGQKPVIDGETLVLPDATAGLIQMETRAYLQFLGIGIINVGPHENNAGFLVYNSEHIILSRCRTLNTASSGIGVWGGRNIILDGNEVEQACTTGRQECVTFSGVDTFEIKDNWIHHGGGSTIGGEGIDVKQGCANGQVYGNYVHDLNKVGIYVDAFDRHTHDIEVYSNVVHNCIQGLRVCAERPEGLLERVQLRHNVVYLCDAGIFVAYGDLRDLLIELNTVWRCGHVIDTWGGGVYAYSPNAQNVLITRNLIAESNGFDFNSEAAEHCTLVDNYTDTERELITFANSPLDFHLAPFSLALGYGAFPDVEDDPDMSVMDLLSQAEEQLRTAGLDAEADQVAELMAALAVRDDELDAQADVIVDD